MSSLKVYGEQENPLPSSKETVKESITRVFFFYAKLSRREGQPFTQPLTLSLKREY